MGTQPDQFTPLRLNSLQSLRGLAAFLVLIFHIADIQRAGVPADALAERNLLSGFWNQGYMGVDLFFVISGFIMVYVTRNTGRSLSDVGRFLKSRITRVYPLWWVFGGLMALYFFVSYGVPADPIRITGDGAVEAYLLKSFLLVPQEHLPVLSIGWTLIHEIYFYVIFALILFLPRRFLVHALSFWAVCVGVLFAAGLARPMANSVPSLMGSLLSLEFIGGAVIALLITRGEFRLAKPIALLGGIALILSIFLYDDKSSSMIMWGRVAVFLMPCLALVYGLAALEHLGKIKIPAFLVSVGDWSYSLYLSHILVLSALKRIYAKGMTILPDGLSNALTLGAPGPLDNIVIAVLGIIACLIFAAFSYRFIECPLISVSRKALKL